MKKSNLRFGLAGCGDFGPELAGYITEVAELAAICDPNPESRKGLLAKCGLKVLEFQHHDEMLSQKHIDAVAIASPNHTHKQIAIDAARAGIHVFCEKSMATNVSDCWAMVRACDKAGVHLMVGQKRRLRPPWSRMIELKRELGEVLAINSCLYFDGRPYYHGWWTREKQSGGTLFAAGVHVIDWMRAMCGPVEKVQAIAGPRLDRSYDFPDTIQVWLQFHSGAIASLNVCLLYPSLHFRETGGPFVQCRQGSMRFAPHRTHIDLYWQHLEETEPHAERFDDLGFDFAFNKELGDFVRWITVGQQPCLTWQEGLRCVEVMEAARLSIADDGKVRRLPLYPELEPS